MREQQRSSRRAIKSDWRCGLQRFSRFLNQHAFLWDHGTLTDLETLGGSFSVVVWLNNAGEAVGGANTTGDELFHATLWRNGTIKDLGTLPGDCFSLAYAVNSKEQIVGTSFACDFS